MNIDKAKKNTVSAMIKTRFCQEVNFNASTGRAPIKREGMMKVKIKRITPWKAPPWKRAGLINKLNALFVAAPGSITKKLIEKIIIAADKNARLAKIDKMIISRIWDGFVRTMKEYTVKQMIPDNISPEADGRKAEVAMRNKRFFGDKMKRSKDPEATYSGSFNMP